MGRGIENHRGKIRITFQWRGKRCRETLDLKDTPPNRKHAERLRAEIIEKIRHGYFDYAEYFPNSSRAGVLPRALETLRRQRAHSQLQGGAVFLNPVTGRAWKDDQSQRKHHWNPALRLTGLRVREPYQCRHTFATMNLMAGANPMWVSQQMGHVDMTMLLTVYSRWIPRQDAGRERAKIEAMLASER